MKLLIRSVLLTVMILFTGVQVACAQHPHALGLHLGYSFSQEKLPEGNEYQPFLIMAHYSTYLSKPERKGKFGIFVEPQFNPVRLGEGEGSVEFGLNAGVSYGWDIGKSHVFGGISSGPHYVSVETDLQARGFIFSDNFIAGLRRKIGTGFQLDAQFRFRHISNAGLMSPNAGIDNWLFVIGFSRILFSTPKNQ